MSRVARDYVDALGHQRVAAPETVARFEALLGDERRGFVAPTRVLRDGEPLSFEVTLPAMSWTERLEWMLLREDGTSSTGALALRDAPVSAVESVGAATYDTRRVSIEATAGLGFHRLTLAVEPYARATVHLIVVPPQAHLPQGRTWGIATQLFTLRSARNDGIGDFADLRTLARALGAGGAAYVGINPLHAGFRSDPEAASPYAASSRRWLNWLAIAVDDVPEAAAPQVRALLDAPDRRATVAALRAAPLVDYTGVAAVKEAALRACFAVLDQDDARAGQFAAWCGRQGEALVRFAIFDVLTARFGRDLAAWPAAFHRPDGPDVALMAAAEYDEVRFGMYLQFLAAEQLAAVAADAQAHGVRLYRDLAVGVDANAADVWANGTAYVAEVSVGAPPDVLNTLGQDWGLPPPDPAELVRDGYAETAALLEANCRSAGALRIDHAFSLARLYWIPRGAEARAGTYVNYPLDDLRGIVALESRRAGCVIIGEDLGTVPDGFRERMEVTGILSYRILFFERAADGSFIPPDGYPALALAASGTHDLPTIPAWLRGDDLRLRDRLGLLETPLDAELAARAMDRTALLDALVAHGDLDPIERDDETAVVIAANRFLAAAPAAIVMAQLDDITGERDPVNVPGTSSEYPNWRRKLTVDVETIASDARLHRLCAALGEIRPRGEVPA